MIASLPFLISVAVPLIFLWLVRRLDLYASSGFDVVLVCALWGIVAFSLSYFANQTAVMVVSYAMVITLVAPVLEELAKSAALVYYARRPEFTYFVDGAVYGFASGTMFAVVENLFKLGRTMEPLPLAVNRAFSTSLMHGTTTALVGVALGRFRAGHGAQRGASLVVGLSAAMILHVTFNNVAVLDTLPASGALLWFIGLGGVVLVAAFIRWGLREERVWLRESLGLGVGVSEQESALVQSIGDLGEALAPIRERFGEQKCRDVEAFIRLQAQLGLKEKLRATTPNEPLRKSLAAEIAELRRKIDERRNAVGVYCMMYVRSILPRSDTSLWKRLELVAIADSPGLADEPGLWQLIGDRVPSPGSAGTSPGDTGRDTLEDIDD